MQDAISFSRFSSWPTTTGTVICTVRLDSHWAVLCVVRRTRETRRGCMRVMKYFVWFLYRLILGNCRAVRMIFQVRNEGKWLNLANDCWMKCSCFALIPPCGWWLMNEMKWLSSESIGMGFFEVCNTVERAFLAKRARGRQMGLFLTTSDWRRMVSCTFGFLCMTGWLNSALASMLNVTIHYSQ